jgi:hypothetical protein
MPVPWRLHVLEERLTQQFGEVFVIESVELYGLEPAEQTAALDALIAAQDDLPVVLVDGVAVCTGDIDADAIAAQVAESMAGADGDGRDTSASGFSS